MRLHVEEAPNAERQADIWQAMGRTEDAALMRALARTPQAIWFDAGPPQNVDVEYEVRRTMKEAGRQRAVPVLVAYYVPGRDGSQYSAGGAPNANAYREWIEAFARGIGNQPALVILEPDGLALLDDQPERGPDAVEERFREIRYAVERLRRNRLTSVYLDAGHSNWQPLLDHDAGYGMSTRLIRAGIDRADGFSLNVSNYRTTEELIEYGTNLSKCVYLRQRDSTARCTAEELARVSAPARELTHFVLDTSRNGQGPWAPPPGRYPDPQDWCNPPGRGLGPRPSTRTGHPLVRAFLWIKRPGESDGQATRGTPGPEDPVYGCVDPPAGAWWPEYALGLAQRANPPLIS